MRVCETVLDPATADWIHETMEGCPATGCPFVGDEDERDRLPTPLDLTG